MDLEKVAAVIRPRSHWEAVDLGFAMCREWARPVFTAWLATVVPIWIVTSIALKSHPGIAMTILWWLRPLFDRVPLLVLSRALFGATPTARSVARGLPRLFFGHALSALTLFRLDPARSFNLPVWELEGLRGSERWNRAAVLKRDGHETAMWVTFGCFQLELAIGLALVTLAAFLVPGEDPFDVGTAFSGLFQTLEAPGTWMLTNAIALVAFSVVEPFYVAAGFSLYLNRRTRLEGWDVELAFRRLARRMAAVAGTSAAAGLLALLTLLPARPLTAAPSASDPKAVIQEVLAGKEFQTKQKISTWRMKGSPSRSAPDRTPPFTPGPVLTFVVRALAYAIVAVGAAFLVFYVVRAVRGFRPVPRAAVEPPAPVVTGATRLPEKLPADVPAAARRLLEEGQTAAALGLLYRAAIVRLVARDGLILKDDWTEGDCLSAVARLPRRERAEAFRRLTAAWQAAAYAHRVTPLEEGHALCDLWRRQFGQPAGDAA